MEKKALTGITGIAFLLMIAVSNISADTLYAGLRCSEYGFWPMPSPAWIGKACRSMVSRFPGAKPAVNWIVTSFDESTNEEYLDYFDSNDIAVILQVEPYEEDVLSYIDDILGKNKNHPSVVGFGIDIEWYYPEENDGLGRKVTDEDAGKWRTKVQSYGSQYFLMLNHFLPAWLPPTEREGILFLDGGGRQCSTIDEFINGSTISIGYRDWAENVTPCMSGIEYGYAEDKAWWGKFQDPQKVIGDSCIQAGPNTKFLFWVDFTAQEFDWDIVTESETKVMPKVSPLKAFVRNNQIIIQHPDLNANSAISVGLYDLNGKLLVSTTYSRVTGIEMNPGISLAKGIYLLQVSLKDQIFSNKISFY